MGFTVRPVDRSASEPGPVGSTLSVAVSENVQQPSSSSPSSSELLASEVFHCIRRSPITTRTSFLLSPDTAIHPRAHPFKHLHQLHVSVRFLVCASWMCWSNVTSILAVILRLGSGTFFMGRKVRPMKIVPAMRWRTVLEIPRPQRRPSISGHRRFDLTPQATSTPGMNRDVVSTMLI